ncbi:MAG: DUF4350 domain-containing protein [Planctomycetes bacterium]|nr:DUF4350 domain-containing protein [Planctomycetota bacterium]
MNPQSQISNLRFQISNLKSVLLLACSLLLAGCAEEIDTEYGKRRGIDAAESVNGTAVLGRMFEQAGHEVRDWRWLSPRLRDNSDTIVWFPDDFSGPDADRREWLEEWLLEQEGRTLIYVGRDFDAAADYWDQVQAGAPANQIPELKRREAWARSEFQTARAMLSDGEDHEWFTIRDGPHRTVRTLKGDPAWLDGGDPSKAKIELYSTLVPPSPSEDIDVLLESGSDVLAWRQRIGGSKLIVIVNGSFLTNLPLVNHEHRKLADRLIAEAGPPGRVVFLESGAGGPTILDKDPGIDLPTGPTGWPLDYILLLFALTGLTYLFSQYPIFGTPRDVPKKHSADFGQHVEALGELLQQTSDEPLAHTKLQQYQQWAKRG